MFLGLLGFLELLGLLEFLESLMLRVRDYIEAHQLLSPGAKVVIGLSGGADSVVLLYILHALGYACEAAHCNFHLRAEESMRDEQFVRTLCAQWQVPLHTIDFDTTAYASAHGVSIEMAARELRYRWFEELRQTLNAEAVAVAHHMNDQAETLLLNLKRGTGIHGLKGMLPKNEHIVRPLLCLTRKEIETICQEEHLRYVTDSTNADTTIRRNAIRALLRDADPGEIRHMAHTADLMREYEQLLRALLYGTAVPQDSEKTLLYELLSPYGFNATQVDNILTALPGSGKQIETRSYVATIDHGRLTIESTRPLDDEPPLLLRAVRPRMQKEHFPGAEEMHAIFDADRLPSHLSLRHWREGDYFYPICNQGQAGRKKLQDFFSDKKLSLQEKNRVWLLADGDEIVWVIGHRIDNRFKITSSTTRVAELSLEE